MQNARMLGNYAAHQADLRHLSIADLGNALHCSEQEVKAFFKGRRFLSFKQLTSLAEILDVPTDKLLQGDLDHYNSTVVHCMNEFANASNREFILDLIDDYLDIRDAVDE